MKRFCIFIFLFLSLTVLSASLSPLSPLLGEIYVGEEGKIENRLLEALYLPFTLEWLESYTSNNEGFILSYTPILSSLLPMENVVITPLKDNEITALSLKTGRSVTFFFEDELIIALKENYFVSSSNSSISEEK